MGADDQAESIRNRLSAIAKIKHLPSAAWPVFPEPNRNHAPGVSSIRASSIRAIAIMTNAVETNRILSAPLKLMYDASFSSRLVLGASPPDLY